MMNYREFTTKVQIEVGRKLGSSYEVALKNRQYSTKHLSGRFL